ncbi:MAG: acetyl-CoA carboxylase biotin carboxylase subunit [Balneolaceae bacterium]|nr:MAG: acetyl-CoA carboxylase biotin carboxylase subunit [Balneolaceae bacterium]
MAMIEKILIANRGEIALRIIRTCKERGISTVAVYSAADRTAPHVIAADESVCIGEPASAGSYLVMDLIIQAALKTGADAIHPGYGFLSENAGFASLCANHGIKFIGPPPAAIELMGDKTKARELMAAANVPCPPGNDHAVADLGEAIHTAESIGFPVLIKAAAGGGGKGMRIVRFKEDFESGFRAARSEAGSSFGDDRVFVEKYLEEPRHIEFQIFADDHGNIVHLFERECSVQRRHQKVIEESPSAILTEDLRQRMAAAAIAATRSCGYSGAGTIEFLVDKDRNFYFLEMNTRLQVEHPVTELITGMDLVALQIDIAEGKKLPFTQDEIRATGHAIECRIYAEDPDDNFMPGTGILERHRIPAGPGVRVDSGVEEGNAIEIYYDPMISKLCTFGNTREIARNRMIRALEEYEITGVKTTIPFCIFAMKHPAFISGNYTTHFVEEYFPMKRATQVENENLVSALAALLKNENSKSDNPTPIRMTSPSNGWWQKRRR